MVGSHGADSRDDDDDANDRSAGPGPGRCARRHTAPRRQTTHCEHGATRKKGSASSVIMLSRAGVALALFAACVSCLFPVWVVGEWPPISTAQPPFPSVVHPLPLSAHWAASVKAPYPTNEWWQNIVLEPSDQPVTISPLAMRVDTVDTRELRPYNRSREYAGCKTDRQGTHCPHWSQLSQANSRPLLSSSTRRGCNFGIGTKTSDATMVATFFQPGFTISAKEALAPHQVTKWDALSVTMQFTAASQAEQDPTDDAHRLELPLVRGMPYATGIYYGLTPLLFTGNAILAVNDQDQPGTVTGDKLRLKMNNDQIVLVYAWKKSARDDESELTNDSEDEEESSWADDDMADSISWKWDRNNIELTGPGAAQGNWVVRLAFLVSSSSLDAPSPEQVYDQYAGTYPTGGSFDYKFTDGDASPATTSLVTSISFQTGSRVADSDHLSMPSAPDLLMMSLPHQQRSFVSPHLVSELFVDSLVGDMVGVLGSSWTMSIEAVPSEYATFAAPRKIDPSRVDAIKEQIIRDIQSSSTAGEPDPYGFGKSLSKLGRMALIATEVGVDSSTVQDLVQKMKDFVAPWLGATNPDQLLHDTLYGGIVSTNGVKDPAADFGQGYYNDHHFHYGYIVYGCAVIAHFDANWANNYRENILALVRDYANPSSSDPFFPVLRHFSIFDGHSWAAGLFVFADGRNQESSSESINAYYAMMLLGTAMGDAPLADLGRMLATMEIDGAKTYWHSRDGYTVYPEPLAKNKCIGMKWSDKVVEATWFGRYTG